MIFMFFAYLGPCGPGTGTMGPWDPGAWAQWIFGRQKGAQKKKRAFLTTENPIGSARPEIDENL